jgi:hypothetical protein
MLEVHITVDAECSIGGAWVSSSRQPVGPSRAILGKTGAAYYGTPLIMDILEASGLRGTFFVEVSAARVVGEAELGEVYRMILQRGHDLQLHLHPVFHYFAEVRGGLLARDQLPPNMDIIGTLPRDTQFDLLREGCAIFHRLIGRRPTAFRAGCYGASHETVKALEHFGIKYDSSFNAACRTPASLLAVGEVTNHPWQVGSVWEIPVTVFRTGMGYFSGLKPLEVSAVSFSEMRRVLEYAERSGMHCVTFVLHSFSLFKTADVQFRRIRPDRVVIGRFRRLCEFLNENRRRFGVRTFSEFEPPREPRVYRGDLLNMGTLLPAGRRLFQGLNRAYWI